MTEKQETHLFVFARITPKQEYFKEAKQAIQSIVQQTSLVDQIAT